MAVFAESGGIFLGVYLHQYAHLDLIVWGSTSLVHKMCRARGRKGKKMSLLDLGKTKQTERHNQANKLTHLWFPPRLTLYIPTAFSLYISLSIYLLLKGFLILFVFKAAVLSGCKCLERRISRHPALFSSQSGMIFKVVNTQYRTGTNQIKWTLVSAICTAILVYTAEYVFCTQKASNKRLLD